MAAEQAVSSRSVHLRASGVVKYSYASNELRNLRSRSKECTNHDSALKLI